MYRTWGDGASPSLVVLVCFNFASEAGGITGSSTKKLTSTLIARDEKKQKKGLLLLLS